MVVYSNSHALFGVRFDDGEKGQGKAKGNTDRLTPSPLLLLDRC